MLKYIIAAAAAYLIYKQITGTELPTGTSEVSTASFLPALLPIKEANAAWKPPIAWAPPTAEEKAARQKAKKQAAKEAAEASEKKKALMKATSDR
jgi:hypothetical protein